VARLLQGGNQVAERWRIWPAPGEGRFIVFDTESLRFLEVESRVAEILEGVMEGAPYAKLAAEARCSENDISALLLRLQGDSAPTNEEPAGRVPAPLGKLSLNVSHICNMRCSYCYARGGDYGHGPSLMSAQTAVAALEVVRERFGGCRTIQFFGGEPLLNWPAILAVCEYIDANWRDLPVQPRLGVVTNLAYLPDQFDKIVNHFQLHVTVSLDGPAQVNDQHRLLLDGGGSYRVVAENIRRLQSATSQPRAVEATFTMAHRAQGWTGDTLRAFFQDTFDISVVLVAPVWDPNQPGLAHELAPFVRDRVTCLAPGITCRETVDPSGLFDMLPLASKKNSPYWCGAGLATLTVTPAGDIYPCQLFLERPEFRIGNVHHGTWDSGVVERLRGNTKTADHVCRACEVRWACRGCIAVALASRGTLNPRDENFCKLIRQGAEETLKGYRIILLSDGATRQRVRTIVERAFTSRTYA